jgi:hypothetical protein
MKVGVFTPQVFFYGYPGMGGSGRTPTPPRPEPTPEEKALVAVRKALEAIRRSESNRIETNRLVEEAANAIRGLWNNRQ